MKRKQIITIIIIFIGILMILFAIKNNKNKNINDNVINTNIVNEYYNETRNVSIYEQKEVYKEGEKAEEYIEF